MISAFCLISLFALSNCLNRINVVPATSTGTDYSYFKNSILNYSVSFDDGKYRASVTQSIFINDAPPFDVISYSILANGSAVDSPDFKVASENTMYYNVYFSKEQLIPDHGCSNTSTSFGYTIECKLRLDYTKVDSMELYRSVAYKMVLDYLGNSSNNSIVEIEGENIVYLVSIKYETNMTTGNDCKTALTLGKPVTYGDDICLHLNSNDSIIANYRFETVSLTAKYKTANKKEIEMNILGVSRLMSSANEPRRIVWKYSIAVVGDLTFYQVVRLEEDNGRRLDAGQKRLLMAESRVALKYESITAIKSWSIRNFEVTLGTLFMVLTLLLI